MARGLSIWAIRFRRKVRMRFAAWRSSLPSSRSAAGSSSTLHAIVLQDILKRNGRGLSCADIEQAAFGKIQILKVVQMCKNGFTGIEGFGSPGGFCQSGKAFLRLGGKSDSKHVTVSEPGNMAQSALCQIYIDYLQYMYSGNMRGSEPLWRRHPLLAVCPGARLRVDGGGWPAGGRAGSSGGSGAVSTGVRAPAGSCVN